MFLTLKWVVKIYDYKDKLLLEKYKELIKKVLRIELLFRRLFNLLSQVIVLYYFYCYRKSNRSFV